MSSVILESIPAQGPIQADHGLITGDLVIRLRDIVNELNLLSGSTEEEFLHLGASLNDFQQRAGDITGIATDVVEMVSGEEIANGIKSLERIVERMDYFLKKALKTDEQSSTILIRLHEVLDDLDEPLAGFRKINKMLRMLGISTRIESTRLAEGAEGFDNLACDVQQLYVQINEKASSVYDLKKELGAVIRHTVERVRSIEAEQRADVKTTLDQASSSLGVLRESNVRCTEFASSITNASQDVSKNISEVVMSMQFHDITRQQIEHAAEALAEVSEMLGGATGSVEDGVGMDAVIGEALVMSELQGAQLTNAAYELSSAVGNILDNLRGITGMEDSISREAREMAGCADEAGSSFFKELESNLASVADALNKSAEENRGLVVALEGVDNTIEEISLFVKSIETIGEEIELIAINAQIKAARTGDDGAALGVLAEAIQKLSLEARAQTGAISGMLKSITGASGDLCLVVDGETSVLEGEVREITAELGELLRMLRNVNVNFISLLEDIDSSVDSLNSDIGRATSAVTVDQRTESVLGRVIDALTEIIELMRPMMKSLPNGTSSKRLASFTERYTMHSERKIHERVAAAKNCRDYSLATASLQLPLEAPGDLGENVELF